MLKNTHDFKPLEGKYVNLREAEVEDAAFILALRTDPKKSRFIHQTDPDLQKQIEYMKHYKTLEDEWYFIIENKQHEPLGTNSVYPYPPLTKEWISTENPEKGILGPGRWLIKDGANPMESIESDYLIKLFFFETLNLNDLPMMIHEDNKTVLNFHKKWGVKIIGYEEKIKHHLLMMQKSDFEKNRRFFETFIYGRNKEN